MGGTRVNHLCVHVFIATYTEGSIVDTRAHHLSRGVALFVFGFQILCREHGCRSRMHAAYAAAFKANKEALWVGQGFLRRGLAQALYREANEEDEHSLVALLRACARDKDLCRGIRVHDDILRKGLLKKYSDALVTMYARCGALTEAQELFNIHNTRDVHTWTALIGGYAHKGHGQDALNYFERMRDVGVSPDAVTYSCILKACGSIRAIEWGFRIHDEVAERGLLRSNIVVGNALVNMYVKCGDLAKAQQVLDELPVRNVISWTALIIGFVEHGNGQQALICFERMQHEGLSPDATTYSCILKACGSIKATEQGEKIHDEISQRGLLKSNPVLATALVDMYAKCSPIAKAWKVLQELPVRNVGSWNALIAGYVEHGEGDQAIDCLGRMHQEGLAPNRVTYACILKACGSIKAIEMGEAIHHEVGQKELLKNDIVLGTALVDMYAKCGALTKARRVLEQLSKRNVVSWTALIAGYTEHDQSEQALKCFDEMQQEGVYPNVATLVCILKACGTLGVAEKGEKIYKEMAKWGLENVTLLDTALVNMYAKCGALEKARWVLKELCVQDASAWTAIIAGYVEQGEGAQGLNCFEEMQCCGISPDAVTFVCILKACGNLKAISKGEQVHDEIAKQGLLGKNIVLTTALVDMYSKCGALEKARQILEELHVQDVSAWTAIIAGYIDHGEGEQALDCFEQMRSKDVSPDAVAYTCALKACGSIGAADKAEAFHNEIAKQGLLEDNTGLGTALVDMYAKCGALAKAQRILEELLVRGAFAWTALIMGYAEHGQAKQALTCFDWMQREGVLPDAVTFISLLKACGTIGAADKGRRIHYEIAKQGFLGKDIMIGNALVDMYARCGALAKAREVLEELPVRNVVSWNALITGYTKHGEGTEALNYLELMRRDGLFPNAVTLIPILKACGRIGAVDKGGRLCDEVSKHGRWLKDDVTLGNALADMYAKCGALTKAQEVLDALPMRNAISWMALIAGYAEQGEAKQALNCIKHMQYEGISPSGATFSCILSACGRLGLIGDAQMCIETMSTQFGIEPNIEHYACLVDLYGRLGSLDQAARLIEKMPSLSGAVWSTLMGACRKWGDVEVGRWAFDHAIQEDKNDASVYVLMADIYATAGMQKDMENIEAMRIHNKIRTDQPKFMV